MRIRLDGSSCASGVNHDWEAYMGQVGATRSQGVLAASLSGFIGLFLLTAIPAAGQDSSASIVGQVTDETGASVPGVTVSATSPQLQTPSVDRVTDERGEYRLAPLP